jgi:hypothetical protein
LVSSKFVIVRTARSLRGDPPRLVAGEEMRRRTERRDHGMLRRNRDGVATMFEMFGKLAVGVSNSPVMAWNRSRSSKRTSSLA